MGFLSAQGWMPMVGADMTRVDSLREIADHISKSTGKPYVVKRFKLTEG